eukprot:scaffold234524_cov35-Tisochrysis_lutea.AAC.2
MYHRAGVPVSRAWVAQQARWLVNSDQVFILEEHAERDVGAVSGCALGPLLFLRFWLVLVWYPGVLSGAPAGGCALHRIALGGPAELGGGVRARWVVGRALRHSHYVPRCHGGSRGAQFPLVKRGAPLLRHAAMGRGSREHSFTL